MNHTLLDFTSPNSEDFNNWIVVSDHVRGGSSSAEFQKFSNKSATFARIVYDLVPLPNGACFAGVVNQGGFNVSGFSGLSVKLRRTGENKWFKIIIPQEYSYEYFFEAPLEFEEIKFPFSVFLPYHWGKKVNTTRPIDLAEINLGFQIFGGVYEDFKQSGSGTLEATWVKAYRE